MLRRSRAALCTYGGISVFFIYGVIMNTYSAFQDQANITLGTIVTYCMVGVPMDLILSLIHILISACSPLGLAIPEAAARVPLKM